MLAAILNVDYATMDRPVALMGETNFRAVAQRYNTLRRSRDSINACLTVQRLRAVFAEETLGQRPVLQSTLNQCAAQMENDPRNFISRLLYALTLESRQQRAGADPNLRFSAADDVLMAPPRLTEATTYDSEYCAVLEDAFKPAVDRPDVAASMAFKWYDPFQDPDESWYLILPEVADRLSALRTALLEVGAVESAHTCDRWLARFCVGVIESSPDDGLQCLAADIIARRVDGKPGAAEAMRSLIAAHTIDAPCMGADWAAQFKGEAQYPLAPAPYETAMESLFLWGLALTLTIGAGFGLAFGVTSIVAPADPATSLPNDASNTWRSRWLPTLVIGLIPLGLALRCANLYGGAPFYAEAYAVAIVQAFVFLSLSLILIHAIVMAWPDADTGKRIRRAWPAVLVACACIIFLAVPAPSATWLLRRVNYGFPQMLWSAGAMILFMMFATLLARVPARQLTRSAALACIAGAALGCVAIVVHVRADRAYQTEVVAAYHDPMAARVGADWKTTYLTPVRRAFNPPLP